MPKPGGIIFDIDHFAVHDGPGIRSVIYFKGCPLRCLWCHSPESQSKELEPVYIKSRCKSCNNCSGDDCLYEARRICGYHVSSSELLDEVLPQRAFYDSSGGGVTLSGGEPLMQPEFVAELLQKLRIKGMHTIIETSMMCDPKIIREIYPHVDSFYCDVKIIDPVKHKQYTGHDNNLILSNIELLSKLKDKTEIVLRIPLIPGYTDTPENITAIYHFALEKGLTEIHLLPYNTSAPAKYEWLSKTYPPGPLKQQNTQQLNELLSLAPNNLNVIIM